MGLGCGGPRVDMRSDPEPAIVIVGGDTTGTTPISVGAGTDVLLYRPGYVPARADSAYGVTATLEPFAPAAAPAPFRSRWQAVAAAIVAAQAGDCQPARMLATALRGTALARELSLARCLTATETP